jgi:hypothetical protein
MTIMISSLLTFTILFILKSKLTSLKSIFFVSLILFYIFNVMATNIYSEYLEYILNSFDLDGDTMFSKTEQTQGQKEAMIALTNDTGRSLAWALSLFYSLIFSTGMLIIYKFTSIRK